MKDVVALGELLIDFAPKSVNEEGYPTLAANPGGAPGNFLAALNRFGCKTALIGKVGDDMFGRLLVGTLNKAGIDTGSIVIDPDEIMEVCGSPKVLNVAMTGALAETGAMGLGIEDMEEALKIRMKPKLLEMNRKALHMGAECAAER